MNNNDDHEKVSVVIATALDSHRATALDRAIASCLRQDAVTEIIVVVNGNRFDGAAYERLRARNDVRVEYLATGSYPAALRRGRELLAGDYYCFLDDDDELLAGSVSARLSKAVASGADVVVCNGYRCVNGVDTQYCDRQPAPDEDVALAALTGFWFASCAPLFRASAIGIDFFDGRTKYHEWTLLLFKLVAANRKVECVADFGFRINDTAVSLSKDARGVAAAPDVLTELLGMAIDARVKNALRARLARAHHACAEAELEHGARGRAWRHHLKSLALPGGLAYLAYTRYLLAAALFGASRRSS